MTRRFTPTEISAQRSIKTALDPAGLLNPGVMLPDRSSGEPDTGAFAAALRSALARTPIDAATRPLTSGGSTDIAVNLGNLSMIVGAEASIEQLNAYLAENRLTCAAVPSGDDPRTIGELVATATGSERSHVRQGLLGVDVALIDGHRPARFGAETMKDVAGYDAKRLFIGGRGAFGTLTTLIFKITVER